MKTAQAETTHTPKRRGYRFWISCLALLLGLPLLLYYSYCFGLWGRNSLFLQYLLRCSCPASSEEARYPLAVDIVVPACHYLSSTSSPSLSPSGRLLHVRTKGFWRFSSYLLDLQTNQKIDVTNQPFSNFLTDDLWFVENGLKDYILDRTTGQQYPIQIFRYWRENAYVNEEPNLELLVSALQQAEQVFFTQNNDTVVVLMSNFFTNPKQRFTFDRSDIPGGDSDRVEEFLQENKVGYQTVRADFPFPNEVISPDGRFIARADGIYLVETDQKIVEGYSARWWFHLYSGKDFSVRGWTYDGTGVIYSKFLNPCLIEPPGLDGPGCWFEVSQPVLKLKVPEEYLLPAETP